MKPPTTLFLIGFTALLAVRLLAAARAPIMDCDETFNYWEPTHYLLYGRGLQTWEYAPQFALRSYGYALLHALLDPSKVPLFVDHACNRLLCLFVAASDTLFLQPFCTHFGALSAISTMSPHSTATLLLPHMLPYAAHAPSQTLAPVANNLKPVANV